MLFHRDSHAARQPVVVRPTLNLGSSRRNDDVTLAAGGAPEAKGLKTARVRFVCPLFGSSGGACNPARSPSRGAWRLRRPYHDAHTQLEAFRRLLSLVSPELCALPPPPWPDHNDIKQLAGVAAYAPGLPVVTSRDALSWDWPQPRRRRCGGGVAELGTTGMQRIGGLSVCSSVRKQVKNQRV